MLGKESSGTISAFSRRLQVLPSRARRTRSYLQLRRVQFEPVSKLLLTFAVHLISYTMKAYWVSALLSSTFCSQKRAIAHLLSTYSPKNQRINEISYIRDGMSVSYLSSDHPQLQPPPQFFDSPSGFPVVTTYPRRVPSSTKSILIPPSLARYSLTRGSIQAVTPFDSSFSRPSTDSSRVIPSWGPLHPNP